MPSKKKKYNARFPAGRIKKIMQSDEEVGKVAQAVPIIISRTLELFVESLLEKTLKITNARNAKTLSPSHMKQCIMSESRFDFLRELVKNIPDISVADEAAAGGGYSSTQMSSSYENDQLNSSTEPGERTLTEGKGNEEPYDLSRPSTSTVANSMRKITISTINTRNGNASIIIGNGSTTNTSSQQHYSYKNENNNNNNSNNNNNNISNSRTRASESTDDEKISNLSRLNEKPQKENCSNELKRPWKDSVVLHTSETGSISSNASNVSGPDITPPKLLRRESAPTGHFSDKIESSSSKRLLQHQPKSVPYSISSSSSSSKENEILPPNLNKIPAPIASIDICNKPIVKIDYSNLALNDKDDSDLMSNDSHGSKSIKLNSCISPVINIDLSNLATTSTTASILVSPTQTTSKRMSYNSEKHVKDIEDDSKRRRNSESLTSPSKISNIKMTLAAGTMNKITGKTSASTSSTNNPSSSSSSSSSSPSSSTSSTSSSPSSTSIKNHPIVTAPSSSLELDEDYDNI